MIAPRSLPGVPVALLLVLLAVPAMARAQERGPQGASAIGASLGAVAGIVAGIQIASRVGDPANCIEPCDRRVVALGIEATAIALGATLGNRGRGSFLADLVVSGVAAAIFADAAGQERYDVAVLALIGQLSGVTATEILTTPRGQVAVSVLPTESGVDVGFSLRPAR